MGMALWIVQILLAVHTAIGAVWKVSNPAQNITSLQAIPPAVWLGLGAIEVVCSVLLLLPLFKKPLMRFVPWAAGAIALEMLYFCGVHLSSGDTNHGQMVYWLIVAVVCAGLAYARRRASA